MYVGTEPGSYEKSIQDRLEFLKILNSVTDIGATLLNQANTTVQNRNKRKAVSDKVNGVILQGNTEHEPLMLEKDMLTYIDTIAPDKMLHIAALDCDENCQHTKGIHIVMEVKSGLEQEDLNDLAFLAKCYIKREHKENCPEIMFLTPGTVKNYIVDENFNRYYFRDDLFITRSII